MAEQQRAGQVADRECEAVQRDRVVADVIELREHQRVREEDRVVQERLRDHQRRAQDRPLGVLAECHAQQRQVSVALLGHDGDGGALRNRFEMLPVPERGFLDAADGLLGLLHATVGDEPAWAFREIAPDEDDHERQGRADQEANAPSFARSQRAEQQERRERANDRAEPVGAVDPHVGASPVPRGHHLIDRRVDGRVLAADAHAGDDPGRVEVDDPA